MKSAVKAFKILEESGFTKENAENFLIAIENDDTQNATKGDLRDAEVRILSTTKNDLRDLEIRILKEIGSIRSEIFKETGSLRSEISDIHKSINSMTWKFLGGIVTIGAIFKAFDIWMGHLK